MKIKAENNLSGVIVGLQFKLVMSLLVVLVVRGQVVAETRVLKPVAPSTNIRPTDGSIVVPHA